MKSSADPVEPEEERRKRALGRELVRALGRSNGNDGFAEALEAYAAAGLSLNDFIDGSRPALHCATRSHHAVLHGASASLGWREDDWKRFERLIKAGADVNAPDRYGDTVLMHALYWGEEGRRLTERLIEAGADVNRADGDGRTALHHAAGRGQPGLVRLLLDAGADPRCRDHDGNEPVAVAVMRGGWHSARALLDAGVPIHARAVYNDDTGTLLHAAARQRFCFGLASSLLEHGTDPASLSEQGRTPLMWAVGMRFITPEHLRIVDGLLKADPDGSIVAQADNHGMNALHHAVKTPPSAPSRRLEYVTRLLAHADLPGADKRALLDGRRAADGYTPLHMVAGEGNARLARLLLSAGADVNARDAEGRTPLYRAHKQGHVRVARLLEEMGGRRDPPRARPAPAAPAEQPAP